MRSAGGIWVRTIAILGTLFAAYSALGAEPLISATLEPEQIALGESANLTITSLGIGLDAFAMPQVAGLEFRVVAQSRRIEIVHGARMSTMSTVLKVTPQVAGIFTIPGVTPKSQPLVLRVSPDRGSAPPAQGNVAGNHGAAPAASESGVHMSADGAAYVKINFPTREVYVGESVPVTIEVGTRSGFVTSLNGLPALTGNDFALNNLSSQPERIERYIDGRPFVVFVWHSVFAAVKPGNYSLSAEVPLTVRVRMQAQRDSMIDDMLGDPFLQNFFGATVSKDIKVSSAVTQFNVLALPTEGRPADFSGAVGSFKITSDISAPTAAAGDPLTLRLHVTGSGNFDRVDSRMLEHLDQWKTYPPKASFTTSDATGYTGEKTFEQPLIASKAGPQVVPPMSFSYFNPVARRYETLHSEPLSVSISPSLADTSLQAPRAAPAASSPASGLRADHAPGGRMAGSFVPPYLRPLFLACSSALALTIAGAWLWLRRRDVDTGRTTVKPRLIEQMEAAAGSGNAVLFFNLARTAMHGEGEEAGRLSALADEASYSGHTPSVEEFERCLEIVRQRLTRGSDA